MWRNKKMMIIIVIVVIIIVTLIGLAAGGVFKGKGGPTPSPN